MTARTNNMEGSKSNAGVYGQDQEATGLLKKELSPAQARIKKQEQVGETILLYATNFFWVAVAVAVIYYSNFFHNLFHNPKINELFFQVSITGYTIMVMFIIYTTFVLPNCMGVNSVEDYNPKLISVGLVVSIISILSLLVAIWPIWGFTSILIFIALLKGFFALQVFLPAGNFGNILFFVITTGSVLSFYIIDHQGYLH